MENRAGLTVCYPGLKLVFKRLSHYRDGETTQWLRVLAAQLWGPESRCQLPHNKQGGAPDLSAGGWAEAGGSLGLLPGVGM